MAIEWLQGVLIPFIKALFIGIFIIIFLAIIYFAFKQFGIFKMIKSFRLGIKKRKLLKDDMRIDYLVDYKDKLYEQDSLIAYCVKRAEAGYTSEKVRHELMLSNKYSTKRIDEMVYVFEIIKKEIGNNKNDDLPTN